MPQQSPVLAPKRSFFQIIALQLFYYAVGLVSITFTLFILGTPWHLHYVFSWEDIRADVSLGWLSSLLWLLDAIFSVLAMVIIVGRSKLATDFASTIYIINLVVVTAYSRKLPSSWLWWALQFVSAGFTAYAGIWASQWRESRRTFFEDYELADIERDHQGP